MEIEKRVQKYNDGFYVEYYHKKGDQDYWHREDGPAIIGYRKDGSIDYEEYRINNKLHKEDGPAYIRYNKNGSIRYEEYRINGKLHREDGPAFISYCENGSIQYEEYWINDRLSSKEDWEQEYSWKLKLKGTPMESIYKEQK